MRLRVVSTALAVAALMSGGVLQAPASAQPPQAAAQAGLQLLMIESEACIYCRQWRAEILPGYADHAAGRAAPLHPIDIDGPFPDGLALARRPRITPTFILTRRGIELSRLEGYPGRAKFWPLIDRMLADRPAPGPEGTDRSDQHRSCPHGRSIPARSAPFAPRGGRNGRSRRRRRGISQGAGA